MNKNTKIQCEIGNHFTNGPLLKSIDELEQDGILAETVLRVKGTRVAYINYRLLQHDFPQLTNDALEISYPELGVLKGAKKRKAILKIIENWLIFHTSFISTEQAFQTTVNTKISIGNSQTKAYRPPGYGRSLVFSIEENAYNLRKEKRSVSVCENRLIDVKGVGVAPGKIPINDSHSNGINSLEFAIFELIMQELLQKIFITSNNNISTIPVYGILDLGFDEKAHKTEKNEFRNKPAGLIARRAHRRPKDSGGLYTYGSAGQHVQLEIELILRKYGITSSNTNTTIKILKENGKLNIQYGSQHIDFFSERQLKEIEKVSHFIDGMEPLYFEGINIQQTREISLNPLAATLVDFQSYQVKKKFTNPILMLVSDCLLRWGGTIWPNHKDFVRPHSKLKIPYSLINGQGKIFGYDLGEGRSKIDSLCYGLAEDFRAKKISSEAILDLLERYVGMLTNHLNV